MKTKNNINPHCHVCIEEFKVGVDVVMNGTFKGIIHADCNYLPPGEIEDRGKFEAVVMRNQKWFSQFNHVIRH
ncbi:hypothetical protein [Cytobacillus oceanisediminis]|uniref:Uncharacterized protein n=1 Tax=Cytobacillus oceanisediminis 2691 TaxID=1196031 RepID=A0A161IXL0_9BACI|nr:hypothetical protein [Cytobacillus oceanisediminis]AND39055.1 hypothetical protein A361_07990 [Cytobacillus oceanisediminis 2691]